MDTLIRIILWGTCLYIAYCGLLFFAQRGMLFPRSAIPMGVEARDDISVEKIWLKTVSGQVEAWFLPPQFKDEKKPAPAIIFAHGNAELIDFWPRELAPFTRLGIGVLLVEYPGYGRSEGHPSEQSIADAFVVAYDELIARDDVDGSRVVLFGRSLGGGAVCALANRRPVAALILMSTFTSVRDFASRYMVPKFLVRDPFDNTSVVSQFDGPVLIVHGTEDQIIPFTHGEALYQAAKNGKLVTYKCGHNNCPPNWSVFREEVTVFLRDHRILSEALPQ